MPGDYLSIVQASHETSFQLDGTQITDFDLCDFRPMFEHFEAEKAKKEGAALYRYAREHILRPGVLGGLLGVRE